MHIAGKKPCKSLKKIIAFKGVLNAGRNRKMGNPDTANHADFYYSR